MCCPRDLEERTPEEPVRGQVRKPSRQPETHPAREEPPWPAPDRGLPHVAPPRVCRPAVPDVLQVLPDVVQPHTVRVEQHTHRQQAEERVVLRVVGERVEGEKGDVRVAREEEEEVRGVEPEDVGGGEEDDDLGVEEEEDEDKGIEVSDAPSPFTSTRAKDSDRPVHPVLDPSTNLRGTRPLRPSRRTDLRSGPHPPQRMPLGPGRAGREPRAPVWTPVVRRLTLPLGNRFAEPRRGPARRTRLGSGRPSGWCNVCPRTPIQCSPAVVVPRLYCGVCVRWRHRRPARTGSDPITEVISGTPFLTRRCTESENSTRKGP